MDILNNEKDFRIEIFDNNYECAYTISNALRVKVNEICEAQGMELPTEQVLFLYDRTMYKGGPMSRVFQLSSLTRELLYQIAGHMFTVALVIQNSGASQLTEAQISNEIYHCLRHIRLNEHTRKLEVVKHHGIEQWQEQLAFFDGGYGYVEDAPNLFDEKIYPAEENDNAAAYLSKTAK